MNLKRLLTLLMIAAIGYTGLASADRGYRHDRHLWHRPSVGIVVSPYWGSSVYPFYPGYAYPYYPVYGSPLILEKEQPQVYIEQGASPPSAVPSPAQYWYYCEASRTYYPYVTECRDGWKKIVPQAPEPR